MQGKHIKKKKKWRGKRKFSGKNLKPKCCYSFQMFPFIHRKILSIKRPFLLIKKKFDIYTAFEKFDIYISPAVHKMKFQKITISSRKKFWKSNLRLRSIIIGNKVWLLNSLTRDHECYFRSNHKKSENVNDHSSNKMWLYLHYSLD